MFLGGFLASKYPEQYLLWICAFSMIIFVCQSVALGKSQTPGITLGIPLLFDYKMLIRKTHLKQPNAYIWFMKTINLWFEVGKQQMNSHELF